MTKHSLTKQQITNYEKDGYISPINIFSKEEVRKFNKEFNFIENKWPEQINGLNRNNVHYYSKVFDKVVHNSKLLDIVEDLLGQNILVAGTCFFVKEPDRKGYISYHQDGKYAGWEPYNFLTVWLALTEVNEENGCMRMWPGTHKGNFKKHKDTFDKNNLLTRGQEIENIPINKTVPIILKPGQISIHHPLIVHGSGPNLSNKKRIGFAIQSYISTEVYQTLGKAYVQQARGKDAYNYHEHTLRPKKFMNQDDLRLRDIANKELQKILYNGANKIGKY
tara:strand:+ start:109 stop:942 length:834 start_codon:yes stop_codon:yes gene_type:complete